MPSCHSPTISAWRAYSSRSASKKCASPAASRCCARGVVEFVRELAQAAHCRRRSHSTSPLTTNGHLLAEMAQPLKDAGLNRVTVSMDAVDPDRFARITRVPDGYDNVLAGIRAAAARALSR